MRPTENDEVIIGYIVKYGNVRVSLKKPVKASGESVSYNIQALAGTILGPRNVQSVELSAWGISSSEFSVLKSAQPGDYTFQNAIYLGSFFAQPDGSIAGSVSSSASFESFLLTCNRQGSNAFKVLNPPQEYSTAYGNADFSKLVESSPGPDLSIPLKSAFSPALELQINSNTTSVASVDWENPVYYEAVASDPNCTPLAPCRPSTQTAKHKFCTLITVNHQGGRCNLSRNTDGTWLLTGSTGDGTPNAGYWVSCSVYCYD